MQTPTIRTPARPSRRRRLALAPLGAALALALVAAACGGDDDTASAGGGGSETVAVTAPADGATVGSSFDVELDVNFPIGEPDTGRDHVHLYYDGNRTEGEYGIAYDTTFTVTGLDPGEHEIEAVVAHADHSTTDVHSDPITVNVTADSAGAGAGTTATTSGADDPYDY
jgi:Bacterial Ig domain